jgi:ABC-type sugar transport system substrate-binding protein
VTREVVRMNRVVFLLGALALLIAAVATARAEEKDSGIAWRTDLEAAVEEAGKEDRPLLVVFR